VGCIAVSLNCALSEKVAEKYGYGDAVGTCPEPLVLIRGDCAEVAEAARRAHERLLKYHLFRAHAVLVIEEVEDCAGCIAVVIVPDKEAAAVVRRYAPYIEYKYIFAAAVPLHLARSLEAMGLVKVVAAGRLAAAYTKRVDLRALSQAWQAERQAAAH